MEVRAGRNTGMYFPVYSVDINAETYAGLPEEKGRVEEDSEDEKTPPVHPTRATALLSSVEDATD